MHPELLRHIWQANRLDLYSEQAHIDALALGRGCAIVGTNESRPASRSRNVVNTDAVNHRAPWAETADMTLTRSRLPVTAPPGTALRLRVLPYGRAVAGRSSNSTTLLQGLRGDAHRIRVPRPSDKAVHLRSIRCGHLARQVSEL